MKYEKEYNEGWNAYYDGFKEDDCPYPNDPEREEWICGWLSAVNHEAEFEYYGDYWPGFGDKI